VQCRGLTVERCRRRWSEAGFRQKLAPREWHLQNGSTATSSRVFKNSTEDRRLLLDLGVRPPPTPLRTKPQNSRPTWFSCSSWHLPFGLAPPAA
jgi:hypothetical protein